MVVLVKCLRTEYNANIGDSIFNFYLRSFYPTFPRYYSLTKMRDDKFKVTETKRREKFNFNFQFFSYFLIRTFIFHQIVKNLNFIFSPLNLYMSILKSLIIIQA